MNGPYSGLAARRPNSQDLVPLEFVHVIQCIPPRIQTYLFVSFLCRLRQKNIKKTCDTYYITRYVHKKFQTKPAEDEAHNGLSLLRNLWGRPSC